MNITQENVQNLLRESSKFVAMLGTAPLEIRVSMPKELVDEILDESSDFLLKKTQLSENELEIDAMLSRLVIIIAI